LRNNVDYYIKARRNIRKAITQGTTIYHLKPEVVSPAAKEVKIKKPARKRIRFAVFIFQTPRLCDDEQILQEADGFFKEKNRKGFMGVNYRK
jgi:cytosine/adenosine deaminase-related metal-dependent hydrolase